MEETRLELQNLAILVVETPGVGVHFIKSMLLLTFNESINVIAANSLEDAQRSLSQNKIDLVLLDLNLSDSKGLETIQAVRATTNAPIVVLTSNDDESVALAALKAGAQDYLFKESLNSRLLWRAIHYTMERQSALIVERERLHLLEQREDFMATVTHDLKNPLIGANRLLELIAEGDLGISQDQQANLLLQIRDSNNNILAMIQNLYEVYRYEKEMQVLHLERTDLLSIINKYLQSVRHLMADKKITTHVVNHTRDTVLLADSHSISRVVQNLIENAIKFSPVEGRVEINLCTDKDSLMFNVCDDGPGIEPQDQERLFVRFYRGRPGRAYSHGMGLGLYLCRQIVEAHRGKIWCTSKQDSGSIFTVSLPTVAG
jgi:signal transduction histidine kinase